VVDSWDSWQQRAAGLLLFARQAGDIGRLLHGLRPTGRRPVGRCSSKCE